MNTLSSKTLEQLRALIRRLEKDDRFMASILARYQKQEKITEFKLAEQLRTVPEMLIRLALCKSPNPNSNSFAEQISEISTYTSIELALLLNLVRQTESLDALSNQPTDMSAEDTTQSNSWVFSAARDNEEEIMSDSKPSSDQSKGLQNKNHTGHDVAEQ